MEYDSFRRNLSFASTMYLLSLFDIQGGFFDNFLIISIADSLLLDRGQAKRVSVAQLNLLTPLRFRTTSAIQLHAIYGLSIPMIITSSCLWDVWVNCSYRDLPLREAILKILKKPKLLSLTRQIGRQMAQAECTRLEIL